VQSWIKGALIHLQRIFRKLLDPLRNRPTVHGLGSQCAKYEEVESALKKVESG
jgi:hypothetical protein